MMNRRNNKRFQITLHGNVVCDNETYKAVIGNVSEEGVAFTITTFVNTTARFIPQKKVALNFNLPSGTPITMDCVVRWFMKPSEKRETIILGLYIVDPPSSYTDWINRFK